MPASNLCSWSPGSYGSSGLALHRFKHHGCSRFIKSLYFRLQPSSRKLNMQVTGTFLHSGRRESLMEGDFTGNQMHILEMLKEYVREDYVQGTLMQSVYSFSLSPAV